MTTHVDLFLFGFGSHCALFLLQIMLDPMSPTHVIELFKKWKWFVLIFCIISYNGDFHFIFRYIQW